MGKYGSMAGLQLILNSEAFLQMTLILVYDCQQANFVEN